MPIFLIYIFINLVNYTKIKNEFPDIKKSDFIEMNQAKNQYKIRTDDCQYDQIYTERVHSIDQMVCLYKCQFNSIGSDIYNGGAILVFFNSVASGTTIIDNCVFTNCYSSNGGAIYICSKQNLLSFQITNSSFTSNYITSSSHPYGGSIFLMGTIGVIESTTFTKNTACATEGDTTCYGGTIHLDAGSDITIENCTFSHNYVTSIATGGTLSVYGGAITSYHSNSEFIKCRFVNNSSTSEETNTNAAGGSLLFYNTTAKITDCEFVDNSLYVNNEHSSSTLIGAAVTYESSNIVVTSCIFINNLINSTSSSSMVAGSVMFVSSSFLSCINCTFEANRIYAANQNRDSPEGGIKFQKSNGTIQNCTFSSNQIELISNSLRIGAIGAASSVSYSNVTFEKCLFYNNYLTNTGYNLVSAGSIFFANSESYILDCSFCNNTVYCALNGELSYAMGGSIYFENSFGKVVGSSFMNNSVFSESKSSTSKSSYGNSGALHIVICQYDLIDYTFSNNYCFGSGDESSALGGSVLFQDSSGDFINCVFYNNTSNATEKSSQCSGGSVFIRSANVTIYKCEFTNNSAYSYGTMEVNAVGGSIYIHYGNVNADDCSFISNLVYRDDENSGGYGGAIRTYESNCTFVNSNFTENQMLNPSQEVLGCGGGLSFGSSIALIRNCTFQNNKASYGGEIFIDYEFDSLAFIIQDCSFYCHKSYYADGESLICVSPSISSSTIHRFINNKVIINNPKDVVIFLNWYTSKITWWFENNCCHPYDENIFFSEDCHFYAPDASEPITFTEAFQRECTINEPTLSASAEFTRSNKFSQSSKFSKSDDFTFTHSKAFSNSIKFTKSKEFSKSDIFVQSHTFSNSKTFTKSNTFSESKTFTQSDKFSDSEPFSPSNVFSASSQLIFTSSFSASNYFVPSPSQSSLPKEASLLQTMSLTVVNIKTVVFSASFVLSNTYLISFNYENSEIVYILTESNFQKLIPYIIYSLSPTYIQTALLVEMTQKKSISPENLIGIICGSCAAFFLILAIVILVFRKKNEVNSLYDDEFSDNSEDSFEKETSQHGVEVTITENNVDNWI